MIWSASEAEEKSSSSAAAAIKVRRRVDTGIWFRYKQGGKNTRGLTNDSVDERNAGGRVLVGERFILASAPRLPKLHGELEKRRSRRAIDSMDGCLYRERGVRRRLER